MTDEPPGDPEPPDDSTHDPEGAGDIEDHPEHPDGPTEDAVEDGDQSQGRAEHDDFGFDSRDFDPESDHLGREPNPEDRRRRGSASVEDGPSRQNDHRPPAPDGTPRQSDQRPPAPDRRRRPDRSERPPVPDGTRRAEERETQARSSREVAGQPADTGPAPSPRPTRGQANEQGRGAAGRHGTDAAGRRTAGRSNRRRPGRDAIVNQQETDSGVAALLSFVVPGLGQLYNSQVERGLIVLGLWISWLVVAVVLTLVTFGLFFVLALLFEFAGHIIAAYDAYDQAEKINEGVVRP